MGGGIHVSAEVLERTPTSLLSKLGEVDAVSSGFRFGKSGTSHHELEINKILGC